MHLRTKAAALYLLPAIAVVGIWCLLLFTGNAPGVQPSKTLSFVLTEGPRLWWFRWLFLLPFLCIGLSAAYFSRVAASFVGALLLLALGGILAVASWLTIASEVALFTTLPLLYGLLVAKEQWEQRPRSDA